MSERTQGEAGQNHLPTLSRLKLIGGAAAASLALLVSGCSSGSETATESYKKPSHPAGAGEKKYDARTEAALKKVIKPATVRYAKEIMKLAEEYPDSTLVQQGKDSISVSVFDSQKYERPDGYWASDSVSLAMTTRREGESQSPDPNAVLSLEVNRSSNTMDTADNYSESFDLYAPYATRSQFVGYLDSHPLGWGAEEDIDWGVGDGALTLDTDNSVPWPRSGNAASIAKRIVQNADIIVDHAKTDFHLDY